MFQKIVPVALIAVLSCPFAAVAGPRQQSAPAAAESSDSPRAGAVNLNTATAAQLESLPGIGAKTAQRILEYRQKSGGFKKLEELMNVKGIGEKSFLKLKPHITVSAPKG